MTRWKKTREEGNKNRPFLVRCNESYRDEIVNALSETHHLSLSE